MPQAKSLNDSICRKAVVGYVIYFAIDKLPAGLLRPHCL